VILFLHCFYNKQFVQVLRLYKQKDPLRKIRLGRHNSFLLCLLFGQVFRSSKLLLWKVERYNLIHQCKHFRFLFLAMLRIRICQFLAETFFLRSSNKQLYSLFHRRLHRIGEQYIFSTFSGGVSPLSQENKMINEK
jgi:hypothetical protein